ncbi:ssDNA endonuclease and repair protein rad10 [Tilletia horrida]|uniref:DNA excision repair protein ERCC-1 n=1 Tax=Tilletia horrida TaxID=155126 RepID=A0AAN6JM92_9BASI|nr:ssDNA endonuclease and repair protein rad10 [Tilletia horrida]KAK0561678.1 ssDNA endonuclease and repair protein rad10 [Tilletia horrida]
MASASSSRAGPSSESTSGSGAGGASGPRTGPRIVQPRPQGPRIAGGQGSGNTILVNACQKGNPILQFIRNVGWEYGDIVPDYQVGVSNCILFLSLRYHRLHPEYIHTRIQKLQQMYTLRVLLVMCDVNDHQAAIKELTKVAVINNLTIVVAWSAEEAGRYVEAYKILEHKPADVLKERVSDDYMSQLTSVLTSVRGVNKTDVTTLLSNFGSLQRIATAAPSHLLMCPGFGDVKVRRLREAFSQPFRAGETRTRAERIAAGEQLMGLKETNTSSEQAQGNQKEKDKDTSARSMTPLADDGLADAAMEGRAGAASNDKEASLPGGETQVLDEDGELDDERLFDFDFFDDNAQDEQAARPPPPPAAAPPPAKRPRIQMG